MKILVIQTVRPEVEIMIYDTALKTVAASKKWLSEKNESELLVKNIDGLFASAGQAMADLNGILVFTGIGAFSATRIGVTVANVMANFGGIKLWEMEIIENDATELLDLIADEEKWKEVKIAVPKYKTEPMITPKKKR